jgi:hypothetical protein
MTLAQNDSAPPRERAKNKNDLDSWSAKHVVMLLRAPGGVQHSPAAAAVNGIALSGRLEVIVALFKKRASFSNEPQALSSGTELAVVSSVHVCDAEPLAFAASTRVSAPE